VPLPDDLQPVGNAGRQQAGAENRNPRAKEIRERDGLYEQRAHAAARPADGKLNGRDLQRPNPPRRPTDHVDVHRPPERGGADPPVSEADPQATGHAQEIQPANRKGRAAPDRESNPLPSQQIEQRDDHDIEAGDESRLSRRGVDNADLLQRRRTEQHQSNQRRPHTTLLREPGSGALPRGPRMRRSETRTAPRAGTARR
jgi:hypothetical protein